MQGETILGSTRFESVETQTRAERVIFAFAGAVCLAPLYEFFLSQRLDPFQIVLLPFWLIAIGGVSLALPLGAAAAMGGEARIVIDAAQRMAWIDRRALWLHSRHPIPWTDLQHLHLFDHTEVELDIACNDNALVLHPPGQRVIVLRRFQNRDRAEAAEAALRRLIAGDDATP